jgi:hypothetical protein
MTTLLVTPARRASFLPPSDDLAIDGEAFWVVGNSLDHGPGYLREYGAIRCMRQAITNGVA